VSQVNSSFVWKIQKAENENSERKKKCHFACDTCDTCDTLLSMALMWVPWKEEKAVHRDRLLTATSGPNLIKRVSYF